MPAVHLPTPAPSANFRGRGRGRMLAALRPAVFLEACDPAPGAVRAPDAGTQTFQLHDLAVVDEEVDVDAVMLEIPFKHRGICGFEHNSVEADAFGDLRDHIDPPAVDVLGDAFRLDHDDLGSGGETRLGAADDPFGIANPFGGELRGGGAAARPELEPELRFRLHPCLANARHQPQQIVLRQTDEA